MLTHMFFACLIFYSLLPHINCKEEPPIAENQFISEEFLKEFTTKAEKESKYFHEEIYICNYQFINGRVGDEIFDAGAMIYNEITKNFDNGMLIVRFEFKENYLHDKRSLLNEYANNENPNVGLDLIRTYIEINRLGKKIGIQKRTNYVIYVEKLPFEEIIREKPFLNSYLPKNSNCSNKFDFIANRYNSILKNRLFGDFNDKQTKMTFLIDTKLFLRTIFIIKKEINIIKYLLRTENTVSSVVGHLYFIFTDKDVISSINFCDVVNRSKIHALELYKSIKSTQIISKVVYYKFGERNSNSLCERFYLCNLKDDKRSDAIESTKNAPLYDRKKDLLDEKVTIRQFTANYTTKRNCFDEANLIVSKNANSKNTICFFFKFQFFGFYIEKFSRKNYKEFQNFFKDPSRTNIYKFTVLNDIYENNVVDDVLVVVENFEENNNIIQMIKILFNYNYSNTETMCLNEIKCFKYPIKEKIGKNFIQLHYQDMKELEIVKEMKTLFGLFAKNIVKLMVDDAKYYTHPDIDARALFGACDVDSRYFDHLIIKKKFLAYDDIDFCNFFFIKISSMQLHTKNHFYKGTRIDRPKHAEIKNTLYGVFGRNLKHLYKHFRDFEEIKQISLDEFKMNENMNKILKVTFANEEEYFLIFRYVENDSGELYLLKQKRHMLKSANEIIKSIKKHANSIPAYGFEKIKILFIEKIIETIKTKFRDIIENFQKNVFSFEVDFEMINVLESILSYRDENDSNKNVKMKKLEEFYNIFEILIVKIFTDFLERGLNDDKINAFYEVVCIGSGIKKQVHRNMFYDILDTIEKDYEIM